MVNRKILTDKQVESVEEIRKEFGDEAAFSCQYCLEYQMLWIENVALKLICQQKQTSVNFVE
jgi:hypothetical protein